MICPVEGLLCSIHRVPEFMSLRRNGVPHPLPSQDRVSPLGPKGGGGGATLSCGWGSGGTQFRRRTDTGTLYTLYFGPFLLLPLLSVSSTGNTQEDWERKTTCTCLRGGGIGRGKEPNHTTARKTGSLVLYNILHTLWCERTGEKNREIR